jgi:hypothetical protein
MTPSFNTSPLSAPPTGQFTAFATFFASAALAKDPRSTIDPNDIYTIRDWMRAVLGNSWKQDLTFDDLMKINPGLLYKAACLYLQGRYWGALPDDVISPSQPDLSPSQPSSFVGPSNPAFGWPNKDSPLEQRIFTWNLKFVPTKPPSHLSYLAEDVNGALYMPIIMPAMLIQKFDSKRQNWRVLNLGDTDRSFTLSTPNAGWDMSGWDFGEWFATNADFATVLKIIGFAVVATAAAVSGGAALAAGGGLFAALGAGTAAAETASSISNAVQGFINAAVSQNIGAAINGLSNVIGISFGVDLKDLATYQPGINDIGRLIEPYVKPLIDLGKDTGGDLLRMLTQIEGGVKAFHDQTKNFLVQLSVDTTQRVIGMFPDQFMRTVLTMEVNQIGIVADKIMNDYEQRAKSAIQSIELQVPGYLNGWKEQARAYVKVLGHDLATVKAESIPWYGRTAFNTGTMIGAIEANMSRVKFVDLNALTPAQKRALFFGDIAQICSADPTCIRTAAEFLRQADLFWMPSTQPDTVQWWAQHYGLYSPSVSQVASAYAGPFRALKR